MNKNKIGYRFERIFRQIGTLVLWILAFLGLYCASASYHQEKYPVRCDILSVNEKTRAAYCNIATEPEYLPQYITVEGDKVSNPAYNE